MSSPRVPCFWVPLLAQVLEKAVAELSLEPPAVVWRRFELKRLSEAKTTGERQTAADEFATVASKPG